MLCFTLFQFFQRAAGSSTRAGGFTRSIIAKAESVKNKYHKLIASSELVAVLLVSVLAGCFVTTIIIGLLGYRARQAYTLIAVQTILSVTFWALLYSGALQLVFRK